MKKNNILKMTSAAVFAAVIFAVTAFVSIKLPLFSEGYFNLGDCFIIIAALSLGPLWGGLAGGIGAALADLMLGYVVYSPATFVIKFLMAVAAYYVFTGIKKTGLKYETAAAAAAAVVAELVMISGYFLFEMPMYGFAVAVADIAGNATQGVCNFIAGTVIYGVLSKTGVIRKLFGKKEISQ